MRKILNLLNFAIFFNIFVCANNLSAQSVPGNIEKHPLEIRADGDLSGGDLDYMSGGDCECPNKLKCDTKITTAEGDVLDNTYCSKGSYFGITGLKCYYWNNRTKKNEERFIKC